MKESSAAFAAYRHRTIDCHIDESGALVFEGRLPAEQGAMLLRALDRAMDWLFHSQPHRARLRHDDARVEDMPQPVRRADALAILAERFLSEPPAAEEGLNTADRFQVIVHAPAEALPEYGDVNPDDPPRAEASRPEDRDQEIARGCRFPGCCNTRFVDGHHIQHWADGGATRLDNLVLLCRHHHRLLHEGGYYVVKDGQHFIFCRGDGYLMTGPS